MNSRAIAAALVILSTTPATAQDATLFDRLLEDAVYTLDVGTSYFHKNYSAASRSIDDSHVEVHERLSLKTQASISDRLTFALGGFAVGSTQSEEYRGAFSLPDYDGTHGRHLDLSEFSVLFEEDAYDVLIGKSPLSVGLSTLASPANRYGVGEGVDPMHGFDIGTWQVTGTYYIEDNSLIASWLPFETRSPTPPSTSRWLGDSGDPSFFSLTSAALPVNLTTPIEEDYREPRPENWAYLLQWRGITSGYDYFFAGHYGPSIYPVLLTDGDNRTIKKNPLALTFSGGFSATIDAWELHGETAIQETRGDQDQDFAKYVVGFIYRETEWAADLGLEEITPIVEWSDEVIFDDQNAPNYILDSEASRPLTKSVITRVMFRRDDELSYIIGGALNFKDHDFAVNAGVEYKPDDNTKITVSARSFRGGSGTQFGRWRKNDHVEVRLRRQF